MHHLYKDCYNKYKKIIDKLDCNIFNKTKIINSFNKFKNNLKENILTCINKISVKQIRNKNICFHQIQQIKQFKHKHKNLIIIGADKNRGNVIIRKQDWDKMNEEYLKKNDDNFIIIKDNIDKNQIKSIVNESVQEIKNIIFKYKHKIMNYKNVLNKIFSKQNEKIGRWAPIPKVHEVDLNGNPVRKIRPIINLKSTIITFSCSIVREISRKIIYALKSMYESHIDCDDVRDIIHRINIFNENNKLNVRDRIIACDINSMYDNITPNMVKESFNYAINHLLKPNYLCQTLIDLWHKAMKHVFKYCYFSYKKVLYLLKATQIQGSKSGGDNCNLHLVVQEIKNNYCFEKLLKFILRYKDDIIFIPKTKIIIKNINDCKNKIISKIYPQFEFEYNLNEEVEICDIKVGINYSKLSLSTTTLNNTNKITSFVNKSSNINQSSINGIFKTLQQRYITIDDAFDKYKQTKKRICNILINNNEWTPIDIRKCEHVSYSKRTELINNYLKKKQLKYNAYINTNNISILDKNWWCKNANNNKNDINTYLTYQKTLIDEKEISQIIMHSEKLLHENISKDNKIKLYFKYQQPIRSMLY